MIGGWGAIPENTIALSIPVACAKRCLQRYGNRLEIGWPGTRSAELTSASLEVSIQQLMSGNCLDFTMNCSSCRKTTIMITTVGLYRSDEDRTF
jgi:hypothetical protein